MVKYESIIEGVTFREESDEQTGHREKVIIETKDKTQNPSVPIRLSGDVSTNSIPVGAHINVDDEEMVKAGQILVKIPPLIARPATSRVVCPA